MELITGFSEFIAVNLEDQERGCGGTTRKKGACSSFAVK